MHMDFGTVTSLFSDFRAACLYPLDAVGFDVDVIGYLFCTTQDTYTALPYGVIVQCVFCYCLLRFVSDHGRYVYPCIYVDRSWNNGIGSTSEICSILVMLCSLRSDGFLIEWGIYRE
jgi:hypothetical protein